MSDAFSDKIALITGASRGLGFAIASALAHQGAQVVALARTVGGLEDLDDEIGQTGGLQPVLVPMDITKDAEVANLTQALGERFGRLDLWVHTAISTPPLAPVAQMDIKDLDRSMATGPRATQRLITALDPLLRMSTAGRALFFDDPAADGGLYGAYGIAKAGSRVLTKAWGQALAKTSKVQVLHLTPPPMATAVRARFHPGEDRGSLTPTRDVASKVVQWLDNQPADDAVL